MADSVVTFAVENPEQLRTVAVVGHRGVGKTTLVEALLHRAGAIGRRGTVEDGTTVCDSDPESQEHLATFVTSVAPLDWTPEGGAPHRVTLLDTPGHEDFFADVEAALTVADLALVVVSAVEGVEEGTRRAWRRCGELGVPRIVFVTKDDKKGADFEAVLDDVRRSFGVSVLPLDTPDGEAEGLTKVSGVLDSEESAFHAEVVEEIVSGDDDQLERYLEGEKITAAEIEATLAKAVVASEDFPLVVGSAEAEVGLGHLLDLICAVGPSPASRGSGVLVGGDFTRVPSDPGSEPLIQVFKTLSDQYVGQISLFKVLSGTVTPGIELVNTTTDHTERLQSLLRIRGAATEPADRLIAGEIGATTRLEATPTRSLLALPGRPVALPDLGTPAPGFGRGIAGATRGDADRLPEALRRLIGEDPSLRVRFREEVGQTVLLGTGDIHLQVAIERLRRASGVEVVTEPVKVPYRSTITGVGRAEGRLKKQSGGHGQFAVVVLGLRPAEPGAGIVFEDKVVGGAIPRQYMDAVRAGALEAARTAGPGGVRMIDVVVEILDGKHHSVDSSDMAFKTAAGMAFIEAAGRARPVLLEPMREVVVTVPEGTQGDVLVDLGVRRGRISSTDVNADGEHEITATVPMAEMVEYVPQLRSITGGRGRFEAVDSDYEPVPAGVDVVLPG